MNRNPMSGRNSRNLFANTVDLVHVYNKRRAYRGGTRL